MFNIIVPLEGEKVGERRKEKQQIFYRRKVRKTATNHSDINFYMDDRIFYQVHKYKLITQHVEAVHYI